MNASACAKIILVGEHAVVYGVPAIAVPLSSVRAYVTVHLATAFAITAEANAGFLLTLQDDHPFVQLACGLASAVNAPVPPVELRIQSDIPVASGLGSGAAIATALARALLNHWQASLPQEALNALIYQSETYYHGTPSGVDNTVIVYEKPVYFRRGHPIRILTNFRPFTLVVANTGIAAPTREAVSDVRRLYEADRERLTRTFEQIAALVDQSLAALQTGDAPTLGRLFNRNHELLRELTVSCPELDQLVARALATGALGAKLSGGGRGGNMIALTSPDRALAVEAALRDAGAVWTNVVEVKP